LRLPGTGLGEVLAQVSQGPAGGPALNLARETPEPGVDVFGAPLDEAIGVQENVLRLQDDVL
jgi:hypothetical protein